ncbi:MAG: DNA repair protein RecO [Actinobacteria bacterium]|nr:DNA repair protein RecO [Actinomycetota bacterium]
MPSYNDEGVVLRTHKLGEADRIVTILTRGNGRVRAVVKGVRRVGSRFGASCEPLSHIDVQLYEGRNLDRMTQAVIRRSYGTELAGDYPDWTAAIALAEVAERLTPVEREANLQQYLLLIGALRAICDDRRDANLVLDAFVLRSMAVAGWSASFHDCARCGAAGPWRSFQLASGGSVCDACRQYGATTPRPQTVALLGALLSGDWDEATTAGPQVRSEASGLVAAFLQWHSERGLRSWPLVERAGSV